MVKKIKLEVELEDGVKIKIDVPDGSREKIENFLKLIELYNGNEKDSYFMPGDESIYSRIYTLIKKEFGFSAFSLGDLYTSYLLKYGEKIKKSTLSTYLSRLVENGILVRQGTRGKYKFKLMQVQREYY